MVPKLRVYLIVALSLMLAGLLAGCSGDQGSSSVQKNKDQGGGVAQAQENGQSSKKPQNIPDDEPVAQVAAKLQPSVVQVQVEVTQNTQFGQQQGRGVGSGVIYTTDGYIITNDHVVADAQKVTVSFADGTSKQAKVVGGSKRLDIAVIKVDRKNLPAANFSESTPIQGQLAVALGSPVGFESTVTAGVISGLGRDIPPQLTNGQVPSLVDLIQTDAAISPGSSGGALANRDGEVVGINAAYLPQTQGGRPVEGLGFAIPAATATSAAKEIIKTGEVNIPYIGIYYRDLSPAIAKRFNLQVDGGALITGSGDNPAVVPGTPAARAGLQEGDVIVGVDDTKIEGSGDLLAALRNYQPGDKIKLTIVRDGNKKTVSLTLGEFPEQQ